MTSETLKTKFGNARIYNGHYHITSRKEGNNNKALHRLIFEDFYKIKIPEGWDIHHEDGNPLNNEIWNLVPMTHGEHMALHNSGENNPRYGKPPEDEIKRKISLSNTSTGIFRVTKSKDKRRKQGFRWVYQYKENGKKRNLSEVTIPKLKKRVLKKGLEWIVLDENKAKECGLVW